MFQHLQIYDPVERRLVGAADAGLALLEWLSSAVGRAAAIGRRDRADARQRGVGNNDARAAAPARILLLRLERIGDFLMAVPAIRAVRALAPDATIDLVVGSWNASLARTVPGVDGIETIDAPWLARGRGARGAMWRQVGRWRARRYDVAINFEGDVRSHVLMRASGAARRIGFDMAGGGPVLTDRLTFDPAIHTASNAIRLVAHAFGADARALDDQWLGPVRRGRPRIEIPAAARDRAAARLAPLARPLVGIQAGGGRAIKQWPPERFGAVAAAIADAHRAAIVFTGAPADRALTDRARAMLPASARVLDVSDTTDLVDVAAILQQLDLFVSGDTGPLHLADAVGTPVVGVYGLTTPARWGPLSSRSRVVRIDLPCSPCNRVRRPPERCVGIVPDCLSGISAESVAAAAAAALAGALPLERT